jgi:hypothetical protein
MYNKRVHWNKLMTAVPVRVYRHNALRRDYTQSFTPDPSPRVATKFFDADIRQNVWVPPHDRLKDFHIVDSAVNLSGFIDFTFDFGAEFRTNLARSGQSLRQLVVGGDCVALKVQTSMDTQRVAASLSNFKNARKQPSFNTG